MRPTAFGLLISCFLLLAADLPRIFGPALPVPGVVWADEDDRREDDEDRDDEHERDDGEDADAPGRWDTQGSSRYERSRPVPRTLGAVTGIPGVAALRFGGPVARGPYLQVATPDAITIRWRTSQPSDSRVRYGLTPDRLEFEITESALAQEHEVRLEGLSPETRYFYSVGTSYATLAKGPDYSFRTAPEAGSRRNVRIWLIGDSGLRGRAQQRVLDAYRRYSGDVPTDVWLLLGDNAYETGTSAQYQAGFFEPYAAMLRSTVVWPARGNHDQVRSGPGNDYYDFFTLPTAGEAGGLPSRTEAFYSFDHANIHFVCLDAERLDGRMLDWLRADLAATRAEWVIAYLHHPPYSKGSHDSDQEADLVQARTRLVPVLEAGGADLVAAGHSHAYERSFLLSGHYGRSGSLASAMVLDRGDGRVNGDGPYHKPTFGRPAPREGTVYVVVGSSAKLSGGRLDHRAHVRSLNACGSLAIDVSGDRLDATFVDDQGRAADEFTIVKGAAAPSPSSSRLAQPQGRGASSQALPSPSPPARERGSSVGAERRPSP